MPKRFLNVEYAGIRTRINVTQFEDLSEVQDAIKAKCGEDHIQDLEDVPEDYFQEEGPCLVIRTSPPPSRQLALFPPCEILFYNNIPNTAEQDGWLVFADNIPSTNLSSLYVRESYQSIAADIQSPAQHFQHPAPVFLNHPPSK
ncbi:hypothetical protein EDD86DRAFT_249911 [Gorgonomyces haynaldii]|nr:hypothetical protein EDD86DRAFT_249911 [Gorgonomyces haynaldii]